MGARRPPVPPSSWLAPLELGPGRVLPSRILPGPMEGVTRGAFCVEMTVRRLVRCWITPFIRVAGAAPKPARLARRLQPFLDLGLPLVVQLMGHEIPFLVETARRIIDLGITGIDLNCACPSKTAIRHDAGWARLRDPRWVYRALVALRHACPGYGLSVKIRAGFADTGELPAILDAVGSASPDFVVLHFRTVREEYCPVHDGLDRLKRARDHLPNVLLFGSGDLFSVSAAGEMYSHTAVDGVAPARGMLRNPQLLCEIEAACGGGPTLPMWTECDRLGFLERIGRTAMAEGVKRGGFILELAGHMFGRTHPIFEQLAVSDDLASLVRSLRDIAACTSGAS